MPARKLDFYLNSSEPLRNFARAAQQLYELQQILAINLAINAPPELTQACRVKQLRAGIIFLLADNAAVATQLKQLSPRLLACYQKQGKEVTSIRIEVQVKNPSGRPAVAVEKHCLSIETIENIKNLADQIEDSPLKDALNRLASRRRAEPKS
jgi:hypothetical protein